MRRLPILALGALATACLRDPDPFDLDDAALSVHAVLEAGADSAVVLISRPTRPGDPGPVPYDPVSEAEVGLVLAADTTWLVEDPDAPCVGPWYADGSGSGAGCYRAPLDRPVAPGAVYGLVVRLPDGGRVTGETRVPEPVDVVAPDVGASVSVACDTDDRCEPEPPEFGPIASVRIAWSAPPDDEAVVVQIAVREVYSGGAVYPGDACELGWGPLVGGPATPLRTETVRWDLPRVTCAGELARTRFDSIRAEIRVVALNPAYTRYAEAAWEGTIRVDATSQGLDGALGVFGAVAPALQEVLLVRDPAPPPLTDGG